MFKICLTLFTLLLCSCTAKTALSEYQSLPEPKDSVVAETLNLRDALAIDPVVVEAEICHSQYNIDFCIEDKEQIEQLMKDLESIKVTEDFDPVNKADFWASYIFTDEKGTKLSVSENYRLSVSEMYNDRQEFYKCLDGASLQSLMMKYCTDEPVLPYDEAMPTMLEQIELEDLPDAYLRHASGLRVYEDIGTKYTCLHLHIGKDDKDAAYGMAAQYLVDGEWTTASDYYEGRMTEGTLDYYFQVENNGGLLRVAQLRAALRYVNDPVMVFQGEKALESGFCIEPVETVHLEKGVGVVIASTVASDIGLTINLSDYRKGARKEQSPLDQRLVLFLE